MFECIEYRLSAFSLVLMSLFFLNITTSYDKVERQLKGVFVMAQIKSQEKRILTNAKANTANSQQKSAMRTAMKKVEKAVAAHDLALAEERLKTANSLIDKSVSDGIQKINTANRQKARLAKLVDTIR